MARTAKNTPTTRETRSPAFVAWHVAGTPDKPFWTRIGAAWKHEDGVGMTLHLEAIPVGFTGRVVLREPKVRGAGA
jgi:hypothetical protein